MLRTVVLVAGLLGEVYAQTFHGCMSPTTVPHQDTSSLSVAYEIGWFGNDDAIRFTLRWPKGTGTTWAAVGIRGPNPAADQKMVGLDTYVVDDAAVPAVADNQLTAGVGQPSKDSQQNVFSLSHTSENNVNTATFIRRLVTTDTNNDAVLVVGGKYNIAVASGNGAVGDSSYTVHTSGPMKVDVTLTGCDNTETFTTKCSPRAIDMGNIPAAVSYEVGTAGSAAAIRWTVQWTPPNPPAQSWFGIGFRTSPAPTHGMRGLDTYIVDTDESVNAVRDGDWTAGNGRPARDGRQNAAFVSLVTSGASVTVRFWRLLDTGDDDDFDIPLNTTFDMAVAFGNGNANNIRDTFDKHTVRTHQDVSVNKCDDPAAAPAAAISLTILSLLFLML